MHKVRTVVAQSFRHSCKIRRSINDESNKLNNDRVNETSRASARAEPLHRTDRKREVVAVPSNTATNNSIDKEILSEEEHSFKFLRWGVDSLYLSYQGNLNEDVEETLKALKLQAQSGDVEQQALAQYVIGDHIFEVKDKGKSVFPYVLQDNAFMIQLSRPNKFTPMAYIKVSSEYLTYKTPEDVEEHLRAILEQLGTLESSANVSRIDLFLDCATDYPMDTWEREAWVTRASAISHYSVDQHFTGWAIGQGSQISARLYDKTREIQKSGKGYLFPLWKAQGWDMQTPVWRLEFQYKREFLDQKAVVSLSETLKHLNGLWSYATTEWLKLTLPNKDDKTRSRWPVHPIWQVFSSVDWELKGGPLKSRFSNQRIPKNRAILGRATSSFITWMTSNDYRDYDRAIAAFMFDLETHIESEASDHGYSIEHFVDLKVGVKARQFNTMENKPADKATISDADQYRMQSDGE